MHKAILSMVVFSWIGGFVPGAGAQNLSPADQMARDIFKQLIEINTTDSVGNVTTAAEAMAERLRNAGFAEDDLHVAKSLGQDRKSTRLNSSHVAISYAVFCLKKKKSNSNSVVVQSNLYAIHVLSMVHL